MQIKINSPNTSLRKKILLALRHTDKELSYDELASILEIKTRKKITDSMTVLRKNLLVQQNEKGVRITQLGIMHIKNIIDINQ